MASQPTIRPIPSDTTDPAKLSHRAPPQRRGQSQGPALPAHQLRFACLGTWLSLREQPASSSRRPSCHPSTWHSPSTSCQGGAYDRPKDASRFRPLMRSGSPSGGRRDGTKAPPACIPVAPAGPSNRPAGAGRRAPAVRVGVHPLVSRCNGISSAGVDQPTGSRPSTARQGRVQCHGPGRPASYTTRSAPPQAAP